MPALLTKHKAQKRQSARKRSSLKARQKLKGESASEVWFFDVSKVARKLGRQIKEKIAELSLRSAHKKMYFSVSIDGDKVTLSDSTMVPYELKRKAPAKVLQRQFDPIEAGRQAVGEMQRAEGGAWTGAELEKLFRLTPANLHKRRTEHRIVSWKDAKNQFHYPKWQFNPAGALLQGVQEVLQTFRSADEWRVMRYFLAPRHQLDDRTPLDLLRAGEVDKVVAHAKGHGEENSW